MSVKYDSKAEKKYAPKNMKRSFEKTLPGPSEFTQKNRKFHLSLKVLVSMIFKNLKLYERKICY